jgi:hypothetical protein
VLTKKDSPRGKLLQQYVLARVVTMAGIDIGLFDYDRHNSIYFFALNADEQIYLRYGGREPADPNTYLNLDSLELALQQGLRQHELYRAGKLLKQIRPAAFYPEQIESLKKNVIERNRCVECHLIGDYTAVDLEKAGKLDKRRVLYPSPDIKNLGIHLDVPNGLVVAEAIEAAARAGLTAGDRITALNGVPVLTFGDLQYQLGRLDRDAVQVRLTVDREGGPRTLTLILPEEWWYTDTAHRFWTVEPMVYFTTKALSAEQRREMGLPASGFQAEVIEVDPLAESLQLHLLKVGDIILEIDGATHSRYTRRPELHLKLTKRAGDGAAVKILREGKPIEMEVKTYRQHFRKERVD